ncbi:MAG TPA: methionyl-tRNA formyltransferase [Longimicrobiales bacterium]|nr:methionyl-tRNA formyltransferase [Longimicrobiales bacterium]
MRIVFWGTPDFALPSLRALVGEDHDVVAVVTQPDRPAGRGRALTPPPVKEAALAERIPVLQPERARGDEFVAALRAMEPDLSVVVAFGQLLRREVLDLPRLGSINVHASLLPALRGAAPINWAIMRGDAQTGITIMRMAERLDAGPILRQVPEPIGPEETARDLAVRLSEIGAEALVETLALFELGEITEREQDEALATYAPRLTREDAHVDWTRGAAEIDHRIRGLDDVPGAWSRLHGNDLKLFRPLPLPDGDHGPGAPGTVVSVTPLDPTHGIVVACGDGAVAIREVKPAGKRRMTAAEWARGRGVAVGDRLE